jgi:hypothetical protein
MRQNRTDPVKRCRADDPRYGTLIATFLGTAALVLGEDRPGSLEQTVLSCDYNGWADVPEEEREAIEAFEAALQVRRSSAVPTPIVRHSGAPSPRAPERRAA